MRAGESERERRKAMVRFVKKESHFVYPTFTDQLYY